MLLIRETDDHGHKEVPRSRVLGSWLSWSIRHGIII